MIVELIIPDIEDDAEGIREPAGDKQPEAAVLHGCNQRFCSDHNQPAHDQIEDQREFFKAVLIGKFQIDTENRRRPVDGENCPPQHSPQCDQRNRRVGARDQKVDGSVIKMLKQPFCFPVRDGMIKGGGAVHDDQGGAEDSTARDGQG